MTLSVIYYSNHRLPPKLQRFCFETLMRSARAASAELICVTWTGATGAARPAASARHAWLPIRIAWPDHICSHANLYRQILAGIEAAHGDLIALAEHDVLYPPGYFEGLTAAAPAGIVYNTNVWRLSSRGFFPSDNTHLLSNCGGPRARLVRRIKQKLADSLRGVPEWAEPAADGEFRSPHATIDIRHAFNFTGARHPSNGRYREEVGYWGKSHRYTSLFVRQTAQLRKPA